ncbi:MAG: hypothetical protein GMKNLPBB_02267 [Myxococcota bacterium]|nr:hypothetical protein [Myxococcota bacterium]
MNEKHPAASPGHGLPRRASVIGGDGRAEAPMLTISIVSYNTRGIVDACLQSLVSQQTRHPFEIWLADNDSKDGTVSMAMEKYPAVGVIANTDNLGFAKANNQIWRESRGQYYLLLNSDTVTPPGALDRLIDFMEAHPRAGACGPRLTYPDGSLQQSVRRFPSMMGAFFTMSYLEKVFPRAPLIGDYMMGDFTYDQLVEVDQPMGACLMLRGETVRRIGPLDERFFMYFEEVDWCLRAKRAGWEIWFVPDVTVVHIENASSKKVWSKTHMYFYQSMVKYYRKNFGEREARALKAMILMGAALRFGAWGVMRLRGDLTTDETRQRWRTYAQLVRELEGM